MLKLTAVTKVYSPNRNPVEALRGVDVEFGKSEFVAILGASGCGKTTMLNIIGGLDRYTSGDLTIDGKSTKKFTESDWDTYRNQTIGFVFQSYNLIPHLTVLKNVEISLALAGISRGERKRRATEVLERVGLVEQLDKKPNELSGGQMQRVAIARALINNPSIVLADEPTGALDSATSVQIMELLKEISRDRLVIMVTHNPELAEEYGTRTIKMSDGVIISDSGARSTEPQADVVSQKIRKSSLSFAGALGLSGRNLLTKKIRTIITAFAGSIGIIGVALVLSLSFGMTIYMDTVQANMLADLPITISQRQYIVGVSNTKGAPSFPKDDYILPYDPYAEERYVKRNPIEQDYIDYLEAIEPSLVSNISYRYGVNMRIIVKRPDGGFNYTSNMSLGMDSIFKEQAFTGKNYDLLAGQYPTTEDGMVLIVDEYNRINVSMLTALGIEYDLDNPFTFADILGREIRQVSNNNYYRQNSSGSWSAVAANQTIYDSARPLRISAIMRVKVTTTMPLLSAGLYCTTALIDRFIEENRTSDIVNWLAENPTKHTNGSPDPINQATYESLMRQLGGTTTPSEIYIFCQSLDAKAEIRAYLDAFNKGKKSEQRITYTDSAEDRMTRFAEEVRLISFILICFASISLVVSSIMIGIIIYVSVIERTKEIGVLRSVGARRRDIVRVFCAEAVIIGLVAGVLGILISFVMTFPLNTIALDMLNLDFVPSQSIAQLNPFDAVQLIGLSVVLTFLGGLIPSIMAAFSDPVAALRCE